MARRWRIAPHDPARIADLERRAGVPTLVAQLLVSRGVHDPAQIRSFLSPKLTALREPAELPGLPAAVEKILSAVKNRRPICVYGDYDADGMTAAAILYRCLSLLGAAVRCHIPNRIDEGYGLSDDALRAIAERGDRLVVTVDCGAASPAEAQTARQLGLELVITDHHPLACPPPEAAALVHPRLPGHAYPFDGLCGAAVAFKLAWALCQAACGAQRVGERMRALLLQAVGLAALGTIADVVPLVDENRVLVAQGLAMLQHRPTVGMAALIAVAGLAQKRDLAAEDVAFTLAPRLNAAGRLGQAQLAVELLTTESPSRAQALADYLNQLNLSRASLERSIHLAATRQIKERFDPELDPALVLADHDWHPGVIGIVAGRLVEKHHRPVVLIALDKTGAKPGQGSARSVPHFNLQQALVACSRHLVSHGGHAAAAGLKIEEPNVEPFRAEFCEHAAATIKPHHRVGELVIDAETSFAALTFPAVMEIERLAPFGCGNQRPTLASTGVTLAQPPKRIGDGGHHVSLTLTQHGTRLRAVAFGHGDWADQLADPSLSGHPLDIAYRPVINEFRGRRGVELQLVDFRLSTTRP